MEHPVILFDGYCVLCNWSVQFVIKRDPGKIFRFASLQSERSQRYIKELKIPVIPPRKSAPPMGSIVLIEDDRYYLKSTAALRILKHLGHGWQLFYGFMIVPRFIRDCVYNIIGRYRYKWFGQYDQCMVPTPDVKDRFLD